MSEIANAKQFPRVYYARHMQPGIARYENHTILADTDAIKRMMPSAQGKPVFIGHQAVDLENIKEQAAGWITESFYNELDGWFWFKMLAVDDECHNAIAKGWSVSNAYRPTERGPRGTKINCPYDWEVRNGEFTHLAIVPDPRYEGACILSGEQFKTYQDGKRRELAELHNSKTATGEKKMFKMFKNTKQEVTDIDAETMVELENGKSVSIAEMVNAITAVAESAAKKIDAEKVTVQTVDVGGKQVPLAELINSYSKIAEQQNAADEAAAKKKKEEEEVEQRNALETAKAEETKKAEGKKNFDELRNAHLIAKPDAQIIETSMDKLQRGQARYGSAS